MARSLVEISACDCAVVFWLWLVNAADIRRAEVARSTLAGINGDRRLSGRVRTVHDVLAAAISNCSAHYRSGLLLQHQPNCRGIRHRDFRAVVLYLFERTQLGVARMPAIIDWHWFMPVACSFRRRQLLGCYQIWPMKMFGPPRPWRPSRWNWRIEAPRNRSTSNLPVEIKWVVAAW